MARAPPSTSSTTQLPTQLLLSSLANAHSLYFPKRPNAVQPDLSDFVTPEQRQEAEHKIALLKSVLSGWMQGVEMDLERQSSGQHPPLSPLTLKIELISTRTDLAATFENLVALAETLPGSFCGIKAKPRFLLYTSRSTPSSTARIPPTPSLLNGSPKKGAAAPTTEAAQQPALSVEGLNSEEDLATFLVWRSLTVSTALQASLVATAEGVVSEVEKKVRAQRQVALNELEGLVKGVVGVLCESAVPIEWRGGLTKDVLKDGGIGKAKELVEELLKTVQGTPFPPFYFLAPLNSPFYSYPPLSFFPSSHVPPQPYFLRFRPRLPTPPDLPPLPL